MTTRYHLQIEVALAASLVLHTLGFGLWSQRALLSRLPLVQPLIRNLFELPRPALRPNPAVSTITFVEVPEMKPAGATSRHREPNIFMETHETQAASQPPPDTQFYGERTTVAANPDNPTNKQGDAPYVEGKETRVLASETVVLAQPPVGVPPTVPPPPENKSDGSAAAPAKTDGEKSVSGQPQPEVKPKELPEQGLAKAEPPQPEPQKLAMLAAAPDAGQAPAPTTPAAPAERPAFSPGRTGGDLATVKSRLTVSGVDRRGVVAFNVAESPFGAYDREIVRAVQSRWFSLIKHYGIYEAGTVTLYFELYDDGKIGNFQRKENTAGEMAALWCEKAITEAAPFEPLPEKLRLLLGGQPRDVTFTFYY